MADIDPEKMYEQYTKPVYRFLLGLCKNPDEAEEMTAETFFRALKFIERYDGTCKLQTWLFQIAKHVWYQEIEKHKSRVVSIELTEELPDAGSTAEDAVLKRADKLELYRRVQQLDASIREVIYLRLSGELSFREIGEILGRTENWARVSFYRGKERMKDHDKK